jgi:hypothetical protein
MGIPRQKRFFHHMENGNLKIEKLFHNSSHEQISQSASFCPIPWISHRMTLISLAIRQCLCGCQERSYEELQKNIQRILEVENKATKKSGGIEHLVRWLFLAHFSIGTCRFLFANVNSLRHS